METEQYPLLLTIYSRNDCPLCDDMIAGLRTLQARFHFEIAIVDVDCSKALQHSFGEDVPVLLHGDRELCRHRLNERLITDYLVGIG